MIHAQPHEIVVGNVIHDPGVPERANPEFPCQDPLPSCQGDIEVVKCPLPYGQAPNLGLDPRTGGILLDEGTADGFSLRGSTMESSGNISHSESGNGKKLLRLPLVSVIVINFNYGRFLRAAVDSVFGQTYPNIECIVVDNASTDESGAVLRAIEVHYANVKIIRRTDNGGKTETALEGCA